MKRIIFLLTVIFICYGVYAENISIDWKVDGDIYNTTICTAGDSITPPIAPSKYGYHFVRWDGYTPIEYLQSTGSQYIDTGVLVKNTSKVVIGIQIPSYYINQDKKLFGSTDSYNVGMSITTIGGKYRGTNIEVSTEKTEIEIERKDMFFSVAKISYGGNTYVANSYWHSYSNIDVFPIFAAVNSGTSIERAEYKCFYFKQFDLEGNIVRDMIPVIDLNGIRCMFDRIEHKFYYNQGTGQFIAGPVIEGD